MLRGWSFIVSHSIMYFSLDMMYGLGPISFDCIRLLYRDKCFKLLFFIKTIGYGLLFHSYCSISNAIKVKCLLWVLRGYMCHITSMGYLWVITDMILEYNK